MNKLNGSSPLALAGATAFAQQTPASKPEAKQPETKQPEVKADAKSPAAPRKADKAAAYYHYAMAHMYEEQVAVYGRSDLANKAIEEYRLAIDADPTSEYLTSGLAELYAKTGRIRMRFSKRRISSSAIRIILKLASCLGASTCVHWATCRLAQAHKAF